MSKEPRTAEQWLALGDELALEAATVLVPGPYPHKWDTCGHNAHNKCKKCGKAWASSSNAIKRNFSCPVPDPIDTDDWNVAMKWRDKIEPMERYKWLKKVWRTTDHCCMGIWLCRNAQPYHYIIAAAMAAERGE